MEKGLVLALGWSEQEQGLWLVLIVLGKNGNTAAADASAVASTLFCIHESVFPLHPLTNYLPDFVDYCFICLCSLFVFKKSQ